MKITDTDFLPVVQRELREGARRPFNYWLRVAGATAAVLLLYFINQSAGGNQAAEGLRLFTGLHEMLLVLICAMVPAMSADCIARETREGTLGLLFLTPLTAMGIVVGKGLVQAFRAFTLWLAVLPVIIIPFLSGGVTGGDVASAITIEFCVTLLCLAAGILASSLARARSTAFLLAAGFAVWFVCLFGGVLGLGWFWQLRGLGQPVQLTQITSLGQSLITGQSGGNRVIGQQMARPFAASGRLYPSSTPAYTGIWNGPNGPIVVSYSMVSYSPSLVQSPSGWSAYLSAPATRLVWRSLLLECWLAVPLLFYLVLRFAALRIARSWHDQPPSLRREAWIKTWCVPLARRRFARKMQRTLDWNPIAWLQQYSWKARLSKWGLCLAFVALECAVTTGCPSEMLDAQSIMLLILAAAFTFVGVNSFLTEKKSGALELLLVTPVSPDQIIFGRVWGLWKQFLPAAVTLLLIWLEAENLASISFNAGWPPWQRPGNGGLLWSLLTSPLSPGNLRIYTIGGGFYYSNIFNRTADPIFQAFVTAIGFLTLPVFATYFALRVKNIIVAAVLTWLALFLCPFFAFSVLGFLSGFFGVRLTPASLYAGVFLANAAFALLACFLLRHSLSRRIYSF